MHDTSHLDAIDLRLSYSRSRLAQATTRREREWYEHSVKMIEQEREDEIAFLAKHGILIEEAPQMTIDEILAEMDELGI